MGARARIPEDAVVYLVTMGTCVNQVSLYMHGSE